MQAFRPWLLRWRLAVRASQTGARGGYSGEPTQQKSAVTGRHRLPAQAREVAPACKVLFQCGCSRRLNGILSNHEEVSRLHESRRVPEQRCFLERSERAMFPIHKINSNWTALHWMLLIELWRHRSSKSQSREISLAGTGHNLSVPEPTNDLVDEIARQTWNLTR